MSMCWEIGFASFYYDVLVYEVDLVRRDLNFDLKNHKDILQLKFFIISYVNSIEQRKYVAV
jgi:hypothetical protein